MAPFNRADALKRLQSMKIARRAQASPKSQKEIKKELAAEKQRLFQETQLNNIQAQAVASIIESTTNTTDKQIKDQEEALNAIETIEKVSGDAVIGHIDKIKEHIRAEVSKFNILKHNMQLLKYYFVDGTQRSEILNQESVNRILKNLDEQLVTDHYYDQEAQKYINNKYDDIEKVEYIIDEEIVNLEGREGAFMPIFIPHTFIEESNTSSANYLNIHAFFDDILEKYEITTFKNGEEFYKEKLNTIASCFINSFMNLVYAGKFGKISNKDYPGFTFKLERNLKLAVALNSNTGTGKVSINKFKAIFSSLVRNSDFNEEEVELIKTFGFATVNEDSKYRTCHWNEATQGFVSVESLVKDKLIKTTRTVLAGSEDSLRLSKEPCYPIIYFFNQHYMPDIDIKIIETKDSKTGEVYHNALAFDEIKKKFTRVRSRNLVKCYEKYESSSKKETPIIKLTDLLNVIKNNFFKMTKVGSTKKYEVIPEFSSAIKFEVSLNTYKNLFETDVSKKLDSISEEEYSEFNSHIRNTFISFKYIVDTETITDVDNNGKQEVYMASMTTMNPAAGNVTTVYHGSQSVDSCIDEIESRVSKQHPTIREIMCANQVIGFETYSNYMKVRKNYIFHSGGAIPKDSSKEDYIKVFQDFKMVKVPAKPFYNIVIGAHNLSFDCNFIAAALERKGFKLVSRIRANCRIVAMEYKKNNIKIILKDTYRIMPMGVADLGKTFLPNVIDNDKDHMIHDLITKEIMEENNVLSNSVSTKYISDKIKELNKVHTREVKQHDLIKFLDSVNKSGFFNKEESVIHFRDYVEKYAKKDVDLVRDALKSFDELVYNVNVSLRPSDKEVHAKHKKYTDDILKKFESVTSNKGGKKFKPEIDIINSTEDYVGNLTLMKRKTLGVLPSNNYSLSTVADKTITQAGCYDNIYAAKSHLLGYLKTHVKGGRCSLGRQAVNDSTKVGFTDKFHSTTKTLYYDAVSLYPSAMRELENGFPAGKPEYIRGASQTGKDLIDKIKSHKMTAFFADFKIIDMQKFKCEISTEVNNRMSFGLYPVRSKNLNEITSASTGTENHLQQTHTDMESDSIRWINDLSMVKGSIKFDNISFNDFCTKLNISMDNFRVLCGVAYTQSNIRITDKITILFNKRLEAKKAGNDSLSNVLKLILNSAYGKTLLKYQETREIICTGKSLKSKIAQNFNTVTCFESITNNEDPEMKLWSITLSQSIMGQSGRYHIGALVLSQSREIMNRVVVTAAENSIPLFYTDTDSIALPYDDIETIKQAYTKNYPTKRSLDGKELGQFHSDFKEMVVDNKVIDDLVSVEAYYCGKKSYIHKVTPADPKLFGTVFSYKKSLKGVTEDSIKLAIHDRGQDLLGMFKDLYDGKEIGFDLNAGGRCKFEAGRGFKSLAGIYKTSQIVRNVKF